MCGIFFSIGFNDLPKSVINIVAHRGPDGAGWEEFDSPDGKVIAAHRRLAILDLSQDGKQPMSSKDGRFWITFNGEIYNYREIRSVLERSGYVFTTNTDTEVILASFIEWGEKCLQRFNGMFAFVIWDNSQKKFFAARDRFGVKPLFYYNQNGKLAFASEMKQLCDLPGFSRTVNRAHLEYLLNNRHHPIGNSTLFANIGQVTPGCYVTSCMQDVKECIWYQPSPSDRVSRSYNDDFRSIFEDSVRKRLISDVPVGALLSGGLDSSAIVCMVAKILSDNGHAHNIETFTSWSRDPAVDEKEYSDAVIAKTGLKNHVVEIKDDSLQADIEAIIYHQEEPFLSTSIQSEWNIYKSIAEQTKLKVVLDGQGSDELTCGYLFMIPQILAHYLKTRQYHLAVKEYLFAAFKHKTLSAKTLLLDSLCKAHPDFVAFIQKTRRRTTDDIYKEIFTSFDAYSIYTLRRFIEPQLKWQDRSSMAFSIESRQPFLDYRLVEFLLSLPLKHKFNNGTTKSIIRNSLRGILPEKVRTRRSKFGFPTPQHTLMQNINRDYFQQNLETGNTVLRNLNIDFNNIDRSNYQYEFFIFSLGLWSKIFQVSV